MRKSLLPIKLLAVLQTAFGFTYSGLSVILNATCSQESSGGPFVDNMPRPHPERLGVGPGLENHCPSSPEETSKFVQPAAVPVHFSI